MGIYETIYAWAELQLAQNEIFAGLVGSSALLSAVYVLRGAPKRLWDLFLFQCTCQLTVYNDCEAFDWLNDWLAQHSYAGHTRRLRLSSRWVMPERDHEDGTRWTLAPGLGLHLFWHKGRPICIRRAVNDQPSFGSNQRQETIELRALGRDQHFVRDIVTEAQCLRSRHETVEVFLFRDGWSRVTRKTPRAIESIVLAAGQAERILADARWFFAARAWYRARSVPYRRGYLFEGPPGTGKSSLAFAMASEFDRPLYIMNLGSIGRDSDLFDAALNVPENAVLLIEDVDASDVAKRRRKDGDKDGDKDEAVSSTSMSALLNSIDGVLSADGRLLIMTTNHPEYLDPALVRPGRVDLRERIGPLQGADAARLFRKFYPDAQYRASMLGHHMVKPLTAAEIQGTCLAYRDDPDKAAELILQKARATLH